MRSTAGRWIVWALAMLTSMGGAWVSWDLTVHHGKVPGQTKAATTQPAESLLSQMCTSLPIFDCEETAQSRWAYFPFWSARPWLHTSSLGLSFFVGMICWLLLVGWPSPSRAWLQTLPLVAAGFGVGMCIVLEVVLWTQLSKPCLLCIMSHAAALLLFLFLILLWPREAQPAPVVLPAPGQDRAEPLAYGGSVAAAPTREAVWPGAWTLMAALLVTAVVIWATVTLAEMAAAARSLRRPGGPTTTQPVEVVQKYYTKQLGRYETRPEHAYVAWELAPRLEIPITGRPSKGPADARHTVVIFSDFECPGCRRYEAILEKKIMPLFALPEVGGVRLVFKHWPICMSCNPYAEANRHPVACDAACAAEAAYVLGGDAAFWRMHDLLFAQQDEWTESKDFAKLARAIGLDEKVFTAAMKSEAVLARVKADAREGADLGQELVTKGELTADDRDLQRISSTPTVYVDGKLLHPPHFESAWKRILTATVAQTQAADQSARVAQLEGLLTKAREDLQEARKKYRFYSSRSEHGYLGWQLTLPVSLAVQNRPTRGPENARHTVVVFGDIDDDTSWKFNFWFTQLIQPKGNDPAVGGVRFVYKHWPMDPDLNPYARGGPRPAAGKAALAAEAAYIVGGNEAFWKMYDVLVQTQKEWKQTLDFAPLARQIGLDEKQFLDAMNGEPAKARVKADIEEGANLGKDLVAQGAIKEAGREWIAVDAAPSIFVDGKRLYVYEQMATWDRILGYVARPKQGGATTRPSVTIPANAAPLVPLATSPAR